MANLCATIINYKTLDLTSTLLNSLNEFYPTLPLLVIDNGSNDDSTDYLRQIEQPNIKVIFNDSNYGHGLALHQAMEVCKTKYLLTFDSDCKVLKPGFIEKMNQAFKSNHNLYAIGQMVTVDATGHNFLGHNALPYIHPSTAMFDVRKYFTLRPFYHHGAPCLQNMVSAIEHGYDLLDYPTIREFVYHQDGGTGGRYGGWQPDVTPIKRPFLSIVTRCYKRPQGLLRCLESIAQQDDKDYENVLIIDTEGIGVAAANALFYEHKDRVHGEYVHLLDDDDILVDNGLVSRLKCIAHNHNWPDVIIFRSLHGGGKMLPPDKLWGERPKGGQIGGESYVIRRDIWKRHIKVFGEHGYPGDFFFISELFSHNYSIFWCDTVIAQAFQQNLGKPEQP